LLVVDGSEIGRSDDGKMSIVLSTSSISLSLELSLVFNSNPRVEDSEVYKMLLKRLINICWWWLERS
jgi:hypothetical protein